MTIDLDNPPDEAKPYVELYERVKHENDRLRAALDNYRAAAVAHLHFDMKSILTGTPEEKMRSELAAVTAARDEACDLADRWRRYAEHDDLFDGNGSDLRRIIALRKVGGE